MSRLLTHKGWLIFTSAVAGVLALLICAAGFLNPRLTRYVESDKFRVEMEKQTAKGLHFPNAHYEPIKRTGTWTARSAGFRAGDGWKALRSIEARGITAKFNPWGVFRRVWQLDEVRVQGGEVGIQVYEPKPEPSPPKPWYAVFLPERVYLNWVESEPVDVIWRFREKRAGFFGTRLLITPHDRDFEYQGRGGELKMSPFPEMRLQHTHLLITKTLLTLYNLDLQSKEAATGIVHAKGKAGTREDKSVDFEINLERMPVAEWMPGGWREHVKGEATGRIHWQGKNPKLETSEGDATFRVEEGRISELSFLRKIATLTGEKEPEHLKLNVCKLDLKWRYPKAEINLILEDNGKFRAGRRSVCRKESARWCNGAWRGSSIARLAAKRRGSLPTQT